MTAAVSIVIPSYRRGRILLDTLEHLLKLPVRPAEILIVDQTEAHPPKVLERFQTLEENNPGPGAAKVRRIVLFGPSIPHAMNIGLQEATGEIVLFLDDDIIPDENLIRAHVEAYEKFPEAWAVAGQVLQPEDGFHVSEVRDQRSELGSQKTEDSGRRTETGNQEQGITNQKPESQICSQELRTANKKLKSSLRRDLGFQFNSSVPAWVENVMAGNLSVKKDFALRVGGFDENFIPPVSFRFETEFAKRLVAAGGKIRFAPAASIKHLRAGSGGTRSRGSHLTSASPAHGVGDVYYALCCGRGLEQILYLVRRPFREVFTKFHLTHPWFIPVKFMGELRAVAAGCRLHRRGPRLLAGGLRVILISTVQADRPNGSMVRYGAMIRNALELHTPYAVEELNLSPSQAWLDRFPGPLQTPLRYLCIAWNARRLLPKQRNAVLHLLDGSHAYLLGALPPLRCPLTITVHDLIPTLCMTGELEGERPGRGAQWILKQMLKNLSRADAVAAVSENTRQDVCRIAGMALEETCTVHSAVDVLSGGESGAPEKSPYILHVAGNNNFYKNRPGVIQIFRKIRERVPVRLKMAGAPPDASLCEQIRSSGLEPEIEFCSNVSEEELAGLYRQAAFLLFPSLYEGFGWPPLEAMALGCPVLCSNAGSLAEIAGDAAWTAAPDDVAGFAGYGIRLLQEPDERRRRVEAGLRQVQNFNLQQLASGLTGAYTMAAERFSE